MLTSSSSQMIFPFRNALSCAKAMRAQFESHYKKPRESTLTGALWEPWAVGQQYQVLRSSLERIFGQTLTEAWSLQLRELLFLRFGLSRITQPLVSLYLDGHHQSVHTDAAHGPLAFVHSLSLNSLIGGETRLWNPELLLQGALFRHEPREQETLTIDLAPKFNQLTLFDPRIPHEVRPVHQTNNNPLHGRLVIHSWVQFDAPTLDGKLTEGEWAKLEQAIADLAQVFEGHSGALVLRFQRRGRANKKSLMQTEVLLNTLVGMDSYRLISNKHIEKIVAPLAAFLVECKRMNSFTLPLAIQD